MREPARYLPVGRRMRDGRRLSRGLCLPRQRLGHDAVLRRLDLRGRRRMRRRCRLPAVLHVRRLRGAPVRLPGIRLRGERGLHRRRGPRVPSVLYPGFRLSATARGVRELDVRRRAVHQLGALPVMMKGEHMRTLVTALVLGVALSASAAGPTVNFTLPVENTTPGTFGALPWPNDLYFDQGRPTDGDGTLLNLGASIGLGSQVITANTATIEDALDLLDGFGTSSAIYFFFSGPIDPATLPPSPRLAPSYADSVLCADPTGTLVPIEFKWNADSRIANVLAILPVPGKPLAEKTTYACIVTTGVKNAGAESVEASADWLSVRDGTSANGDADAIFDPAVASLGTHGVAAADIAGMTVFTTQSTIDDLVKIRDVVLPGLPLPTADLSSRPELVFDTAPKLDGLFGDTPHGHIATVATGYYPSPRFQTLDPDGNGALSDLPVPPAFATCAIAFPCETTDE